MYERTYMSMASLRHRPRILMCSIGTPAAHNAHAPPPAYVRKYMSMASLRHRPKFLICASGTPASLTHANRRSIVHCRKPTTQQLGTEITCAKPSNRCRCSELVDAICCRLPHTTGIRTYVHVDGIASPSSQILICSNGTPAAHSANGIKDTVALTRQHRLAHAHRAASDSTGPPPTRLPFVQKVAAQERSF
jgi:hypothetical protein